MPPRPHPRETARDLGRNVSKTENRRAAKALIGTTVQGRYHVVRLLGDGGMGAVYKAADTVLRRFVAIKMLHPSTAENASAVERFVREARSSAAIGHPNIIDVLDFGYEKGRPYLVMEYLRGRSLSEAIAEEGRLSIARACNIATHSLAGLAAAHDRGILHRDLKPANMMLIALLGDRDFVKLCDFGFAALVQPSIRIDDAKTLTPARTLVGTPAYAAPERLRGDDRRDPRIDVWSIGVVLFEMLAGGRPFDAPTFRELARKVRKDPAPSLRKLRRDVPRGLDAVVQKALAKEREGRFSSAAEFAAALVPFGGRVIPDFSDAGSDSFTMDLLRLRARETQQRVAVDGQTGQPISPEELEELRRRFREETKAPLIQRRSRRTALRAEPAREEPRRDARDEHTHSEQQVARRRAPEIARSSKELDERRRERIPPPAPPAAPPAPAASVESHHAALSDFSGEGEHTRLGTAFDGHFGRSKDVLGAVPLAILHFVSRRFGERRLTELLNTLEGAPAHTFRDGVGRDTWIPYEHMTALVEHVDAMLGRDDLHLVVQCGRAAAESGFERMRAVKPPAPPPKDLMRAMPMVLQDFFRGLVGRVPRLGQGFARLEIEEVGEPSLVGGVFLIGFLDRSLDRFGAKEVEVNLSSTPALGDQACIYDISWLAK